LKTHLCSNCLADAHFIESGHDEQMRKFDLYFCETCENYTRDFMLTERETVEHEIERERRLSLMPKALSGNLKQLKLGMNVRVSD